ncbi:MAG: 3-deoxy-D-manno-octulosonic acid transferase [Kiritimatiellae bacterium]|jgi:3-deoxy-D-manno-octulosonic-acid transferase|nr:3-deoxy-D-manno-octulosonic acid transferase [Kiritimatiellia bacterium]NLD90956.1 3-deoxy-D-manno-octulosonic acid transferase [Lentisphaerota bacterium]HOU20730.1 3-deoxy-D-manno-octulosonic acid transferase [Kiritimatiellia bacterium]HPC20141.1 3-deoxy-D-manno-octulosonic acid transferase [Kiritimatiellia bacterium]HQN79506.1 3-deoxy-D-manno-octulosonic acid transferase [Kiritimatiellia bacterium]
MIWWLYNLVFPVAFAFLLPHFLLRMLRRGGYARDFAQRVGWYAPAEAARLAAPGRPIWIQAVSVGELAVAFSFMDELRHRRPATRFVLTTNTSTGHALALKRIAPPDVTLYFPMDVPWVVPRALRRIRPAAIVLVENELWPNLIRYAARQGIPTIMINGRISEHSFRGYRRIRFLTRRLLPQLHWFCVQSAGDRDRLLALGAPAEKIEVTGSAKYDIGATPPTSEVRARAVLANIGVKTGDPVLVGGSTWSGEEDVLLDIAQKVRASHPRLMLVLVPRHAERREDVLAAIRQRGMSAILRSQFPDHAPPPVQRPDVLLVDTTGELRGFYAAAHVVFVGKSLTQVGGQNPIEPAKDGKPVVVGPHMENFPEITRDFQDARAWRQVRDAAELQEVILRLLGDCEERARLGKAAAELVARKAGATRGMALRVLESSVWE